MEASIRARLFDLPGDTVVHTGHGEDTTVAAERANLAAATIRNRIAARLPGEECVP
ncbi:hypothetical protein [Pimelobacter simplex]|uniref:hypothetical protein n=1 Tax=Nocardioides simplex TaxID=2045 RepID=UPI004040B35D